MLPSSRINTNSYAYISPDGTYDVQFPDYFRRLIDVQQMDFESTFDQMFHLLSFDPEKGFKNFFYRKQTKNQWARDDPAFLVVEGILVAIGSLAYAIAFHKATFWGYIMSVLYCLVFDWLLLGAACASTTAYISNKYLKQHGIHTVDQDVEWLYAFDVHMNAYICSFSITYVVQYFLLPLLMSKSYLACICANVLYAVSLVWYFYITYIGYKTLPFLGNTQVFLWYSSVAIAIILLFLTVLLVLGMPLNLTRIIMNFHYS